MGATGYALDALGTFSYDGQNRALPSPPTAQDVLKKMKETKEGVLLLKHINEGKTLEQVLFNPPFK